MDPPTAPWVSMGPDHCVLLVPKAGAASATADIRCVGLLELVLRRSRRRHHPRAALTRARAARPGSCSVGQQGGRARARLSRGDSAGPGQGGLWSAARRLPSSPRGPATGSVSSRASEGACVRDRLRRERKKPARRAAASGSRTPDATATRCANRPDSRSSTDPAQPPLASRAAKTRRATRASRMAPAHMAHGSSVT